MLKVHWLNFMGFSFLQVGIYDCFCNVDMLYPFRIFKVAALVFPYSSFHISWLNSMIFEVFTAVHIKITVFWGVTLCSLVSGYLWCSRTGYHSLQTWYLRFWSSCTKLHSFASLLSLYLCDTCYYVACIQPHLLLIGHSGFCEAMITVSCKQRTVDCT